MTNERNRIATALLAAILLVAVPSLAQSDDDQIVGVVSAVDATSIEIETEEGTRTLVPTADTIQPEKVAEGDPIIVRVDADGQHVTSIYKIHDRVMVTEQTIGERRVVLGTVKTTGTDGMVVETANAGSTFLVRPDKLFPPLPTPGDTVGILYRVQELAEGDRALADEIVILPEGFEPAPRVEISYQTVTPEPSEPAERETIVAESTGRYDQETARNPQEQVTENDDTEPVEADMEASLPKTAGSFATLGLAGLAAFSAGFGLRRFRRRS